MTVSQSGNSIIFASAGTSGSAGDMFKSVYDSANNGIVNEARLADSCQYSNLIGTPVVFAPVPTANWPESQITGNTISGATGGLVGDLGAVVPKATLVNTRYSLIGGGALSASLTLNLVNDVALPGNNKYYATNGSGIRGWLADPYLAGGMSVATYAAGAPAGAVNVAVLANTVGAGAVSAGGLATGAVTADALAAGAVGAVALATGAVAGSLGYTPVSRVGDIMTGSLQVNKTGAAINTSTWQNAHLLLQTSGNGSGFPALGFGLGIGGTTPFGAAMYYTGGHTEFQLEYSDGVTAAMLTSLSVLQGSKLAAASVTSGQLAALSVSSVQLGTGAVTTAKIAAGAVGSAQIGVGAVANVNLGASSVGAVNLAFGAAASNIGFPLINPLSTTNNVSGAIHFLLPVGLNSSAFRLAPITISNNANPSGRAGIGFVNENVVGVFLYLGNDGKFHFIDDVGTDHLISSS